MLDIVLFSAAGVVFILSLIRVWSLKWKRVWNELWLPLLWLWLTEGAIRDRDHLKIALSIVVWLVIAWPYMKRLWIYAKRRHV